MAAAPNRLVVLSSRLHVFLYRLLGGAGPAGRFRRAPVLLLTTTGRKSGRPRTRPLLYGRDGDDFVVVAGYGDSDWRRNLKANPGATVQVKRETIRVRAQEAAGDERDRLWSLMTTIYPTYDALQKRSSRPIPVVLLKRTHAP